MFLQIGVGGPGRAVDALQLGVAVIPPPVGAGQLHQLEGLAHVLGRGKVRAEAEILPGPLVIDADRRIVGQVGDDLGLVGLADRNEVGHGGVAGHLFAGDLLVAVDDLAHALLDGLQVIQGEGLGPGEVVIEAVLDGGPNRHLGVGEQLLHRLCHDVAGVVAHGLQGRGVLPRQELYSAALGDQGGGQGPVEVQELAVHPHQHGAFGQARGNGGGDVAARDALVVGSFGAVGELKLNHGSVFSTRGGTGS